MTDAARKGRTMAEYEALAHAARPTSEDDWGSERQLAAENAFFATLDDGTGDGTILGKTFDRWCLKATTEEMLDEALRLLRERTQACAICEHWVERFGLGFHPDTRGAHYVDADGQQSLTGDEAQGYDEDMETLFGLPGDPYEHGLDAMRRAGLIDAGA